MSLVRFLCPVIFGPGKLPTMAHNLDGFVLKARDFVEVKFETSLREHDEELDVCCVD